MCLSFSKFPAWLNWHGVFVTASQVIEKRNIFPSPYSGKNKENIEVPHYWRLWEESTWGWPLDWFPSQRVSNEKHLFLSWASYQICKIAGCAWAGNAGNVPPRRRIQRKLLVSDPGMHHGTCVTHVPWCMSGSLTHGGGENVPGIPGACASTILHIWQEAHNVIIFSVSAVCGVFLLAFGGALGMVRASRSFHKALLSTVLKLPMSFFDTTPKGRILNRFSKDVDSLDDQVRTLTIILLFQLCAMCATIAAICYTTPWFTALAVILVCLFLSLQVRRWHDDVSKWKHFPRYGPFMRGIHQPPVDSFHKDRWCGALVFSLICVWTKSWTRNRDMSDLRRHRAHYDLIVIALLMSRHNFSQSTDILSS